MLRVNLPRPPSVRSKTSVPPGSYHLSCRIFKSCDWRLVPGSCANRAFAGSGVTVGGALASRFVPDVAVGLGRGMLDAIFSFMVMASSICLFTTYHLSYSRMLSHFVSPMLYCK